MHRLTFSAMYRLGLTPWDGHPLPAWLREQIEQPGGLLPGRALDVGCGTGDTSIYLAEHGWQVTGIDFVKRALDRARIKTSAAGVTVRYQQADVTRLAASGVGGGFDLIVDNGCLHGLNSHQRDAYGMSPAGPNGFHGLRQQPQQRCSNQRTRGKAHEVRQHAHARLLGK